MERHLPDYRYHRADGKRRPKFYKHPGKYGLFVEAPARYRHDLQGAPRPPHFHMHTSADSVEPLLHYRTFLKPYLLAYVAKAERWS